MPVRWSRRGPIAIAMLFWLGAAPSLAVAQPPAADEARKSDARSHFQRGLELSDDQAWDAAYAEFTASIGIYPTKAATKNAALCLRMMHRYAEALEMLERFLRFPNLNDDDRAFSDREMRDVKRFVGSLVV